jgi:hypothetical protein
MTKNAIALYSGSGIGLLIGVLMGLAVSPTVGIIIGALASVLAVLLGLNDAQFGDAKGVRIGSFGFACVIGAFFGIFVRTHNLLSPSPRDLLDSYVDLGFSKQQVLKFVAYKEFGILDKEWKMADTIIASTGAASGDEESTGGTSLKGSLARSSHASVLFSADVDLSSCNNLEDLDELPASEIVTNFDLEEGVWKEMAGLARSNLNSGDTKKFLLTVRNSICAQSSGKVDDASCAALSDYPRDVEFAAIRDGFARSPGVLSALGKAIEGADMATSDMARALWIIKTSLCETADNK